MKPLRRNISLAFAALLLSASVAASQNAPAPRTDGEGINMDAVPPTTAEPHHPADPLSPNTAIRRRAGVSIVIRQFLARGTRGRCLNLFN